MAEGSIDTAAMLRAEFEAVKTLRNKRSGPWLGLALSGGGIRSASFAMGVMQGLQARNLMKRFDYLSTVSGGGYIGASLSYFLSEHALKKKPEAPDQAEESEFWFPFGRKGQHGARSAQARSEPSAAATAEMAQPLLSEVEPDWFKLPIQIVSFIRQHANYLTPSPELGIFALVGNALRAVLFSLGIYFAMLVIVITAAFGIGRTIGDGAGCACTLSAPAEPSPTPKPVCLPLCAPSSPVPGLCVPLQEPAKTCAAPEGKACSFDLATLVKLPCGEGDSNGGYNPFAVLGLAALIVTGAVAVVYSVGSYFVGAPRKGRDTRLFYRWFTLPLTRVLGFSLKIQVIALIFGSLPWTYGWAEQHGDGNLFGAISVAIAYLGTLREKHALIIGKLTGSPLWKSIWPYLYAILAIYGILFLAFGVSEQFRAADGSTHWIWVAVLTVATAFLGIVTSLNLVSQHRMYRDRLMEAMCPDLKEVKEGMWGPASIADAKRMSVLAGGENSPKAPKRMIVGPYHLINTALIIPDSPQPKYSGRGADSFTIAPLYCGSDATNWAKTKDYMGDRMVLPTAMAISGAAFNAHSGPDGKGILRTPLVSFLMTLFGTQLGFWAPNPRHPKQFRQKANYWQPGLLGLFGFRMNEYRRFLQLSDGGHFENLGLYELIRRKLDLILVSDGGQDGEFSFADLGNAIERVRVDFGVSIHFDDPDFTLEGVLPQQREALSDAWAKKFGLAKRGFAIASIIYPGERPEEPEKCGVLIYIKATMIEKLPSDLYAYKAENPEFPDQSTLDQFFDEDQFEAYRELGYRLTKQMTTTLGSELVHKWPEVRKRAKSHLAVTLG
jgi:hypothetical protein